LLFKGRRLGRGIKSKDDRIEVESVTVNPSFRGEAGDVEDYKTDAEKLKILFVSESGICRSQLACAIFRQIIEEENLTAKVECISRACRDYALGEPVSDSVAQVAQAQGIPLDKSCRSELLDLNKDVRTSDLVIVVDKFVAADVMRDVSLHDTIHKSEDETSDASLSRRVRRLGDWHPVWSQAKDAEERDIVDPLYGNYGGEVELDAVGECAFRVHECCLALAQSIKESIEASSPQEGGKREAQEVAKEDAARRILEEVEQKASSLDWLVPPMLKKEK